MSISFEGRRSFLRKTSVLFSSVSLVGLTGCSVMPVFYGEDHNPIIDAHAHIFNSRDQQQLSVLLYVFLTQFSEENKVGMLFPDFLIQFGKGVGKALANLVERIPEHFTPTYSEETQLLDSKLKSIPSYNFDLTLSSTVPVALHNKQLGSSIRKNISNDEALTERAFLENYALARDQVIEMAKAEPNTKKFLPSGLSNDYKIIVDYIRYKKGQKLKMQNKSFMQAPFNKRSIGVNANYAEFDEKIMSHTGYVANVNGHSSSEKSGILEVVVTVKEISKFIDGFLKVKGWIDIYMTSVRSHLGNAKRLNSVFDDTYTLFRDGKQGVDHFVTASVDMDYWVNSIKDQSLAKDNNHTLHQQYALIEKTALLMNGKILPMVSFCPWREYAYREKNHNHDDSPLGLLKSAILKHGFVGVKVYPPMGFWPIGNREETDWPEHAPDDPKFGVKLDDILFEFFTFCVERDVPVMAHANPTMHTKKEYSKRASAQAWEKLLSFKKDGVQPFKNLRLNLAHSGGIDNIISQTAWVENIFELTASPEYPNIYADFSNFDSIDQRTKRNGLIRRMRGLDDEIKKKIMYGSDWSMLAKYYRKHKYLAYMLKSANQMSPKNASGFMGVNCLKFLGFDDSNNLNLTRLKAFYAGHGMRAPNFPML